MGKLTAEEERVANIKTVLPEEWTDVTDGLIGITCGHCGFSHDLLIRETGPGMQRVRLDPNNDLMHAVRATDKFEIPLYREVVALRERNVQRKRLLEKALEIAQSDLMSIGHDKEGPARDQSMANCRTWIAELEAEINE